MEHTLSLIEAVNMVSRNYPNIRAMIQAHKHTNDLTARALLEVSILVHLYLKLHKPQDMKTRIEEVWNQVCQE